MRKCDLGTFVPPISEVVPLSPVLVYIFIDIESQINHLFLAANAARNLYSFSYFPFVTFNYPIPEPHYSQRMIRNIFFVRDQYNGIATIMNIAEYFHDLVGCFRIEVACRFIGKDDG